MRILIVIYGLFFILLDMMNVKADKEHVHIRLKIPKLINKHTHTETKYIHIYHPVKAHHGPGFLHRNDALAPTPYNATSMEITSKSFKPSTVISEQGHKYNSNEITNHRYNHMRKIKMGSDQPNVKYYILNPVQHSSENRRENKVIIGPTYSIPPNLPSPAALIGARHAPYSSQESLALLSEGYVNPGAVQSPPQRLNRIAPPIPQVKSSQLMDGSYEEKGKTKYWTASGKKHGKKKPYHGPKKLQKAESKRIKMTIRPKSEKKVTKLPFIIKV